MKKTGIQFLLMAGLFLLVGQVFADEPSQPAIKKIRSSNNAYSTPMSSDRKATIMGSDGKR